MVSALSRRGGDLTMRALEKGAFDFITKPEAASRKKAARPCSRELAPRVRAVAHRLEVRSILRGNPFPAPGQRSERDRAASGLPGSPISTE